MSTQTTVRPFGARVQPALRRRAAIAGDHALSLLARARRSHLDPHEARLILGTGRSGTTWLLEALAGDQRSMPVFEPMYRHTPPPALRSMRGFQSASRGEAHPHLQRHLEAVFSGEVTTPWTVRGATLRQLVSAERAIVKAIRLNAAAGWIEDAFPTVRIAALVRHPCAVVASMRVADGGWRLLPDQFFRDHARRVLGVDVRHLLGDGGDEVRRFALLWAIDAAALLQSSTPSRTRIVGYEELQADPYGQLASLDRHLELGIDLDVLDLRRASMTTTGTAANVAGDRPRWADQLSRRDSDVILGIATELGIPGVTLAADLDIDAIRSVQGR